MNRFTFTPDAERDVEEIAEYLQSIPRTPALRIGREIQDAIKLIVERPNIGRIDEALSRHSEQRILRSICGQYVLFYYVVNEKVRIVGLLHGKRDIDSTMARRF